MTPRELLARIRMRAYALTFAGEGRVSFEAAKKQATKEITSAERAKKRALQHSPPTSDGITVSGARAALLAKLNAIGQRLKATAGLETESTPPPPQIRKHTLDPVATRASPTSKDVPDVPPINKQPEPEQPPASPVLVFGTSATVERIDDREFANSLRWGDTATDNWRKSIELNERIQREKEQRSRWIG
jgi:hypothetical protein